MKKRILSLLLVFALAAALAPATCLVSSTVSKAADAEYSVTSGGSIKVVLDEGCSATTTSSGAIVYNIVNIMVALVLL